MQEKLKPGQGVIARWADLPAGAFRQLAKDGAIGVLPLGAIEQHGPHLPVGTDTHIADGLVAAVENGAELQAPVLILPTLAITNSIEHTNAPGTLSIGRDLALAQIMSIARGVHAAGLRKMVIINAHGGNVGVMVDASHAIRAELAMLCVATNWMRLGLPDGIISETARATDIHGGQLETSLMLALQPDLVAPDETKSFTSLQADLTERYTLLRAYGPVGFGWMGDDLNPAGAVGDARSATAEDGKRIIAYQAERFATLLNEVADFTPDWFSSPPS